MKRKAWLGVSFALAVGAGVVVACGDDDATITAADAGTDGAVANPFDSGGPGNGGNPGDAGPDADDGEPITDGGANLDPDAGDENDDAGADAGPCNTVKNEAPSITSNCISIVPGFGGGTLVAGKYYLTAVNDLGSGPFCATRFVSSGFKETMELTVDAQGVGTANTVAQIGTGAVRHRTATFDRANAAASLHVTPTCPPGTTATDLYSSGIRNNKQIIRLRLPYGQGEAVYVFEKQ